MQKLKIKKLYFIFIIFLLFPWFTTYGADGIPDVVRDIVFQGNTTVELETIDFLVKLSPGAMIVPSVIRRDVRTLYATGMFEDISVNIEPMSDGYRLVFVLKERPVITDVVITGAEKIGLNTLREEITVKNGKRYDPVTVRESVSKMEEKYREKGYHFVIITPRISGSQIGLASLVFDVDEGTKLKIRDIVINGNEEISDGTRFWGLKSRFKENQEWWWLSFISDSGIFREDLLIDDVKSLEKYYRDRGYLRVAISEPVLTLNRPDDPNESASLTLKVDVEEGPVYRLGDIDVEVSDGEILSLADVERIVKVTRLESYQKYLGGSAFFKAGPRFEPGQRYSLALEEQAITNLADVYGAMGYIYSYIIPERTVNDENHTVDIKFRIIEGKQAFMHRLEFRGNNRTRDRVLRRNIAITEGGIFNTALIKSSIGRLNYLPYIDEVIPDIVPQVDPTQIDMYISLSDKRQTEIHLSGGYSGYNKRYGTIGRSGRNLFGMGQELYFSATAGEKSETVRFSFTDEWIMDRPYYGSIGVWDNREEYDFSDQKKRGGSLVGGRSFGKGFSSRLGYTYERNKVYNVSDNADDDVKELEGTQVTSSITNSWIYNTLNDKLHPNDGFYGSVSLELAGTVLGGENNFYKARMAMSNYWSLTKKLVFALKGELNIANGMEGDDLPFYERFRLGGPHSIRGYEDYSVGPMDEYGQNLGGNKSLKLSAELQIPIAQPLKLIFFIDAGDSWASEDEIDIRTLRPSTGFEVRFFMPGFGVPLRFIWGYNLDPYEGENRNDFQFTMGTSF
ncbi:outer membrane protein assembly factor BamA [bacterium]|nr:outer membrane protein assembly factor BamA [bacterium]